MDATDTTPIPMNGKIETPLSDSATWKTETGIEVVHRQFACGLEQQLTISRRSVVVIQRELEKAQLDITLLNERLRERAESFNEADAKRIHRIQELEAQLPTK